MENVLRKYKSHGRWSKEFLQLDEQIGERIVRYRPSHIAKALDQNLSVEQAIDMIEAQNAREMAG